jgi:hypothetical protein
LSKNLGGDGRPRNEASLPGRAFSPAGLGILHLRDPLASEIVLELVICFGDRLIPPFLFREFLGRRLSVLAAPAIVRQRGFFCLERIDRLAKVVPTSRRATTSVADVVLFSLHRVDLDHQSLVNLRGLDGVDHFAVVIEAV